MSTPQKSECDHEYPCTECGGDAYIGASNWTGPDGEKVIKEHERLCMKCSGKRGIGNPFRSKPTNQPSAMGGE